MSNADGVNLDLQCPFWYLAKFEGERSLVPHGMSDADVLKADLANPQCVEIIVGGQNLTTQVWRK